MCLPYLLKHKARRPPVVATIPFKRQGKQATGCGYHAILTTKDKARRPPVVSTIPVLPPVLLPAKS